MGTTLEFNFDLHRVCTNSGVKIGRSVGALRFHLTLFTTKAEINSLALLCTAKNAVNSVACIRFVKDFLLSILLV